VAEAPPAHGIPIYRGIITQAHYERMNR